MSESRLQADAAAATVYEEFFVPALFSQWAHPVLDAAEVQGGDRVLDVACGTGVLTRAAAERVAPAGSVTGLDANRGMLAVAERLAPEIDWAHGDAESLPFDDESFESVVSQFGLMFFADRTGAIAEMIRVLAPGGRVAVAVWDSLDNTPGYAELVGLLQRMFGEQAAEALRAPFALGDRQLLASLVTDVVGAGAKVTTRKGVARFPSVASWIHTDVKGWSPLGQQLDEEQFERLQTEAESTLSSFVTERGTVEFPMPAHIVTTRKA